MPVRRSVRAVAKSGQHGRPVPWRPACSAMLALWVAGHLAGCGHGIVGAQDLPATDAFSAAGCVEIVGYDGDAMEPFIEPQRGDLLFNNRNSPPERTDLHWARRIDAQRFQYVGAVTGANSPALDGVPSVDGAAEFFFVSTRFYDSTLATLYRGQWANGTVSDVEIVRGVSRDQRGWLNFDAEISRDGRTLYFVDGRFSGGEVPDEADIAIARRDGTGFIRDANSASLLATVNTAALEYAPAVSADGLELFFTRLDLGPRTIAIYRATRPSEAQPFARVERIGAAGGFVEAPALSADGRTLYFHQLDNGQYRICRAVR